MTEDQAPADITATIRRMQALFTPAGTRAPDPERMLALHQEMTRRTQAFTRHWLARRQEAAETGIEALQTLAAATRGSDPAAALGVITEWQRGSFRRLDADLQEWVALCTQITRTATAEPEPDAPETPTDGATPSKKTRPTSARPAPTSRHATPV